MRILVVTSEPVSAERLRSALHGDPAPEDAEVMVVTPALQENPLKFWLSDADEAIARADRVRLETVDQLGEAGVSAVSETGESDPEEAIADALRTFPAERIVLFTHPESGRYREDLDPAVLEERFGLPVAQA
jgi:hypothetical protein